MLDRQAMRVRCKGLAGMRLIGTTEAEARTVLGDDFPAALDLLDECEQVLSRITRFGALQGLDDCYELLAKLKGRK